MYFSALQGAMVSFILQPLITLCELFIVLFVTIGAQRLTDVFDVNLLSFIIKHVPAGLRYLDINLRRFFAQLQPQTNNTSMNSTYNVQFLKKKLYSVVYARSRSTEAIFVW